MINHKKTRRVYRELGLQFQSKTLERRVKVKLRDDRKEATCAHETWAMDFVHDHLATGSKLPMLTVVDLFSRFAPVIDSRFSYRGEDVVATLERVCAEVGYPARSASISAQSPSRAISISGRIRTTSRLASAGPASRRTTRSSRRSTVDCAPSASTRTGS